MHRIGPISSTRPRRATAHAAGRLTAVGVSLALAGATGLAGCSDDPPRTTADYCAAVGDRIALIATPAVAAPADITAAIEAFEAVTARAPAAVEPEWREVLEVMRAAASVDRADPTAMEAFVDDALAARPSITRVQQYTQQICAIDIGTPPTPTNPALVTAPDTGSVPGNDTEGADG